MSGTPESPTGESFNNSQQPEIERNPKNNEAFIEGVTVLVSQVREFLAGGEDGRDAAESYLSDLLEADNLSDEDLKQKEALVDIFDGMKFSEYLVRFHDAVQSRDGVVFHSIDTLKSLSSKIARGQEEVEGVGSSRIGRDYAYTEPLENARRVFRNADELIRQVRQDTRQQREGAQSATQKQQLTEMLTEITLSHKGEADEVYPDADAMIKKLVSTIELTDKFATGEREELPSKIERLKVEDDDLGDVASRLEGMKAFDESFDEITRKAISRLVAIHENDISRLISKSTEIPAESDDSHIPKRRSKFSRLHQALSEYRVRIRRSTEDMESEAHSYKISQFDRRRILGLMEKYGVV